MIKWGVRSMVWYVLILIVAFGVSLYYYLKLVGDPTMQMLFF